MAVPKLDLLPVELLYEIHLLALSESLPLSSKRLYAVYKFAPASVHAEYLIARILKDRTTSSRALGIISMALRYPLCSVDVLKVIIHNPHYTHFDNIPALRTELPRRLFRKFLPRDAGPACTSTDETERIRRRNRAEWTDEDEPLPFLRFLYDHPRIPRPYADSHEGYALTKAVHAGFLPLIHFLLDHGALPHWKDGLAVLVAIRQKDLKLVKTLVERNNSTHTFNGETNRSAVNTETDHNTGSSRTKKPHDLSPRPKSAKRRKLEDRVKVNQLMLKAAVKCDARDIVEYLMKDKGCVPDMQTVLLMRK